MVVLVNTGIFWWSTSLDLRDICKNSIFENGVILAKNGVQLIKYIIARYLKVKFAIGEI
jgi:hypothetical protein